MKDKKRKRTVLHAAVITALLLLSLVLTMCGCSSGAYTMKLSEGTPPISADSDTAVYVCNKSIKELEKLSVSGRISLYYDKQSCCVCVHDSDTGMLWRSLPEEFNSDFPTLPSILELDIIANRRTYTVNSQSCCVKNGLAVCEKEKGGMTVRYSFLIDADSKSVNITVPVQYVLRDGSLFVSVDCADIGIESNTEVILREIRLMNYFGSTVKASKDDFMLVPDGCGALIDTRNVSKKFQGITLKVYGTDYADGTDYRCASVGAYGFRHDNSAALAVIESGEALACIRANIAALCGYNYSGAGFTVTASGDVKNKTGFSQKSYDGQLRLCFRFLSESNSTYAAMASACREQLIRNDVLSPKTIEKADALPAVVSVLGAVPTGKSRSLKALTSFEQTQDMLTLLKAKGFGNIWLRYRGLFEGGTNQTDIAYFRFNKLLGNEDELTELTRYADAQGMKLFYDIHLLSCAKGGYAHGKTAESIGARAVTVTSESGKRELLRLSKLEQTVLDILGKAKERSFTGFCLNDTGSLYADYSDDRFCLRQDAMQWVTQHIEPLVTGRELMCATGNLFALKNAFAAVDIPMTTGYETNGQYRAVPFLQMVIHGSMYYTGEALNYSEDADKAILRCIEYGAVPCYELCYETNSEYEAAYYSTKAVQAAALYEKAAEALDGLCSERITDHYKVQDKVYCTEYGGSTLLYVNYSDKEVKINDTVIEPHNFLRIG